MAKRKARQDSQKLVDPTSEAWRKLPWRKFEQHVYRIQKRIYRANQRGDTCIGYLGHPFEKEAPWASTTLRFPVVRWDSAINRGEEWFLCTRENTGGWAANHQGRHAKAP